MNRYYCLFFNHLQNNFVSSLMQYLRKTDHVLYTESSHSVSMPILIMLWSWTFLGLKVVIIRLIWSIEKSSDGERSDRLRLKSIGSPLLLTNELFIVIQLQNTYLDPCVWFLEDLFLCKRHLYLSSRNVIIVANTYALR